MSKADVKTPEEAMALIAQTIMGLPDDAYCVESTIGRRAEHVGGTWYWGVSYRLAVGPAHNSRLPDRTKVLSDALAGVLKAVAEITTP